MPGCGTAEEQPSTLLTPSGMTCIAQANAQLTFSIRNAACALVLLPPLYGTVTVL
jgi:hypothetical protein